MAVDMFMKIVASGSMIEGESQDEVHTNEIDVLAWSWGTSQTGSSQLSKGSGAGKASVQDLTFSMHANKSCPTLWQMVCGGTTFDTATLVIRKAGGSEALEYIKIVMTAGLIANIAFSGTPSDDYQAVTVSLNFSSVEVHYTPQVAAGTGDAEVVTSYDIIQNKIS